MKYKRGFGPDDILPDMYWCLEHGQEAAHVEPIEDSYCWKCLSDAKTTWNGEKIVKCRVICVAEHMRP